MTHNLFSFWLSLFINGYSFFIWWFQTTLHFPTLHLFFPLYFSHLLFTSNWIVWPSIVFSLRLLLKVCLFYWYNDLSLRYGIIFSLAPLILSNHGSVPIVLLFTFTKLHSTSQILLHIYFVNLFSFACFHLTLNCNIFLRSLSVYTSSFLKLKSLSQN